MRKRNPLIAPVALLLSLLFAPPLRAEDEPTPRTEPPVGASTLEAARAIAAEAVATVDRLRPAVVAIEVQGVAEDGTPRRGGGSGVVVDESGLVLTNWHVAGWSEDITVIFAGSRRMKAKVRGADREGDLTLLEVEAKGPFPAVELGDSDQLRVGQWVLAMGNPKGVSTDGRAVVTWGSVTGLNTIGGGAAGRELFYGDAIQTDAEINPGNSGGPLFDLAGRLIGINGRIASRSRVATGAVNANIGFAISVNQIRRFLPLLREGAEIRHGFLGVRVEEVEDLRGVRVSLVVPESAADQAGIERGDRLLAVDGEPVETEVRLTNLVTSRPAGTSVALRILRDDAERIVVARLTPRMEVSR